MDYAGFVGKDLLFSTRLRTCSSFTGIKENEFSDKRDEYNPTGGTSGIENRST